MTGTTEVVIEPSTAAATGCAFVGVVFGGIVLITSLPAIIAVTGGVLQAVLVLTVVLVAIGVITSWSRIAVGFSWRAPDLVLPVSFLPLGSETTIRYRRRARRPRDLDEALLECTLICEEVSVIRRGKNSKTRRRRVVEDKQHVFAAGTPDGMEAAFSVTIPADRGGPTIELRNNRITWHLLVTGRSPVLPRDLNRFELTVVPVLDEAHRYRPPAPTERAGIERAGPERYRR